MLEKEGDVKREGPSQAWPKITDNILAVSCVKGYVTSMFHAAGEIQNPPPSTRPFDQ